MKLGTFDRLILLNILPEQGDITCLRIMRKLREDLSFSEKEHKALKFKTNPDNKNIEWKREGDKPKEVVIGDKARGILAERFKKLSEDKLLTVAHLDLYEKFVDEDAPED